MPAVTALQIELVQPRPPARLRERLAFPLLVLGLVGCLIGYAAVGVSLLRFVAGLLAQLS
jgi:hypothetical protein